MVRNIPFARKVILIGPRIAYALGLGPLIGKFVLLLTTCGRKSGRPRVTPLVYEQRGKAVIVASARGRSADWLRDIESNPQVRVRIGRRQFDGIAEVSTDPEQIAGYLQRQMVQEQTACADLAIEAMLADYVAA